MSCGVDEERFALDQHRFRTTEFPHSFSELGFGGMFQIETEYGRVVAFQNLLQNLVMLFAFGSGQLVKRLARPPVRIDEF